MAAADVPTALATCARRWSEVEAALEPSAPRTSSRTTGSRPARASSSPTRARSPSSTPVPASPSPTAGSWSRRSSTGPRCRSSASATARPSSRSRPRRTSSASATTTPAPTPVAWRLLAAGLGPRGPGRRDRAARRPADHRRDAPPWHALRRRPLRRPRPHRPRPRSSSSTHASATRPGRHRWPDSRRPSPSCCSPPPPRPCRVRSAALVRQPCRRRGRRLCGYPLAAYQRPDHRARRRGEVPGVVVFHAGTAPRRRRAAGVGREARARRRGGVLRRWRRPRGGLRRRGGHRLAGSHHRRDIALRAERREITVGGAR